MSHNQPQDAADRSASESEEESISNRSFGDKCLEKEKGNTRVMFLNVNGLGYSEKSVKTQSMKNVMLVPHPWS